MHAVCARASGVYERERVIIGVCKDNTSIIEENNIKFNLITIKYKIIYIHHRHTRCT